MVSIYTCSPNCFANDKSRNYPNFECQKSKLIMTFTIKNISVTPLYDMCNPLYDSVKILWAACIVGTKYWCNNNNKGCKIHVQNAHWCTLKFWFSILKLLDLHDIFPLLYNCAHRFQFRFYILVVAILFGYKENVF